MAITWNSDLHAKAGQKAKDKTDEIAITDKNLAHHLKVSLFGVDSDIEDLVAELVGLDGFSKCSLTYDGPEANLKAVLKKASELIAKSGGQTKLDVFKEPMKAQ